MLWLVIIFLGTESLKNQLKPWRHTNWWSSLMWNHVLLPLPQWLTCLENYNSPMKLKSMYFKILPSRIIYKSTFLIIRLYKSMLDWGIKPNQNTHVVMLRGAKWNTIVHHNKILEERNWFSCISMSVFIDSCGYNDRLDVAIGIYINFF